MKFLAYKNRWGSVVVKPYDFEELLEARKSPSVLGTIAELEAGSLAEAEGLAAADFKAGRFMETFAEVQAEQVGDARPYGLTAAAHNRYPKGRWA